MRRLPCRDRVRYGIGVSLIDHLDVSFGFFDARAKVAQVSACRRNDNLYTKLLGIQLVLNGVMVFAVLGKPVHLLKDICVGENPFACRPGRNHLSRHCKLCRRHECADT